MKKKNLIYSLVMGSIICVTDAHSQVSIPGNLNNTFTLGSFSRANSDNVIAEGYDTGDSSSIVTGANPDPGSLSVDSNRNVIYASGRGGCCIGNLCSDPANPLTGDYEVPMDGFNYSFTNVAQSPSQVSVGLPGCMAHTSKFGVYNDFYQVAGGFASDHNNSTNIAGIYAIALNAGTGNASAITGEASSQGTFSTGLAGRAITPGATYCLGVNANAANGTLQSFGVNSDVMNSSSPLNYGYQTEIQNGTNPGAVSYGVHSTIFNQATTNYAGYFVSQGSANNYAVYASATPSSGTTPPTGPNYAGYFNGDVLRTGTDNFTSDFNLKKTVTPIKDGISTVSKLNPVTFEFKQSEYPSMGLSGGTNYGFIAQEVEKVLPDLVKNELHPAQYDNEGTLTHEAVQFKSMNYQGIIPVLTKAVQEQSELIQELRESALQKDEVIDDLHKRLTDLENCLSRILPSLCQINHGMIRENSIESQRILENVLNVNLTDEENIILNQNVPNPFAESTIITYNIPESVREAQICFYDMNGKLIQTVRIATRGTGHINVFGSDLSMGTYTYTLIADGQIISSKKMVKE